MELVVRINNLDPRRGDEPSVTVNIRDETAAWLLPPIRGDAGSRYPRRGETSRSEVWDRRVKVSLTRELLLQRGEVSRVLFDSIGEDVGVASDFANVLQRALPGVSLDASRLRDWCCAPSFGSRDEGGAARGAPPPPWTRSDVENRATYHSHLVLCALCAESIAPAVERLLGARDADDDDDDAQRELLDLIVRLTHGGAVVDAVFPFEIEFVAKKRTIDNLRANGEPSVTVDLARGEISAWLLLSPPRREVAPPLRFEVWDRRVKVILRRNFIESGGSVSDILLESILDEGDKIQVAAEFTAKLSAMLLEDDQPAGASLDAARLRAWCVSGKARGTKSIELLKSKDGDLEAHFASGDFSSQLVFYALCARSIAPALEKLRKINLTAEGEEEKMDIVVRLKHKSLVIDAVFPFRVRLNQ